MAVQLQQVVPTEIEAESFKIISAEFGPHTFDDNTYRVIQRVIHATGDFSFKDNMRFAPGAIASGIKAIRAGKNILTDVSMVAAGISKTLLDKWGGKVFCRVGDEKVAALAAASKRTRSEVAIDLGLSAEHRHHCHRQCANCIGAGYSPCSRPTAGPSPTHRRRTGRLCQCR